MMRRLLLIAMTFGMLSWGAATAEAHGPFRCYRPYLAARPLVRPFVYGPPAYYYRPSVYAYRPYGPAFGGPGYGWGAYYGPGFGVGFGVF